MSKDVIAQIKSLIGDYITRTTTPGVAVALHFNGADHILCSGYADLEQKVDVTSDTIFEIASMTKVFTATLLASQVVKQVIPPLTQADNLPFQRLPPSVGASGKTVKEVTYIQLATHMSGLQDTPESLKGHPSQPLFDGQSPSAHLTQWWIHSTATPGVCWEYSNIGFVTLGFAVVGPTTSSGYQSYDQLLKERITGVLGMPSTSVHASGADVAVGYHYSEDGPVASKNEANDLKSSARDILTFLRANLGIQSGGGAPVQDLAAAIAMTQQLQVDTPTNCISGKATAFGMGLAWQISTPGTDTALFYKDGATGLGGFRSFMAFAPTQQIAVSVLTNLDGNAKEAPKESPATLTHAILKILSA